MDIYLIFCILITFIAFYQTILMSVMNFGRDGTSAMKIAGYSYWISPHLSAALKSYPHIVIIEFGTNDMMSGNFWNEKDFIHDYTELINKFKKLKSEPTVYLSIPGPVYNDISKCETPDQIEQIGRFIKGVNVELPIILRKIALSTNSTIIDLFKVMGGVHLKARDAMNVDNLHPNDFGYTKIAHEIAFIISNTENFTVLHHHNKHSSFHSHHY